MKTFLIISVCFLIIMAVVTIIALRLDDKNRLRIESALTCKSLYIDPDLEDKWIFKNRGEIKVREDLDWIKISRDTLERNDIRFFETYDPSTPTIRKLVIAEEIDHSHYSGAVFSPGQKVLYYEGNQAYIAECIKEVTVKGDKVSGYFI